MNMIELRNGLTDSRITTLEVGEQLRLDSSSNTKRLTR